MMRPGLVSVTFRGLSAEEIIDLAGRCGLGGIEWGGDVHVPCGDLERAHQVGERTRQRGLEVVCYGSYCRMMDLAEGELESVVATAEALGAPLIRVWAGKWGTGSASATERHRAEICENTRRLASLAEAAGMDVAFEYHGGTLTDTSDSAVALLREIGRRNVGCLWQPPVGMSTEDCLKGIAAAADFIRNIHVFSWTDDASCTRMALREGEAKWSACLEEIGRLHGDRWLLLEFVRGDLPGQLEEDAACLKKWLERRVAE